MTAATVAILVTELQAAGAERVVLDLATRLDPARFRPFVVALARPGGDEGALARAIRQAGVEAYVARVRRKRDAWRLAGLYRRLAARRPALLHGHLFHGNVAARAFATLLGVPVISTHHVVERRPLRLRLAIDRLTSGLDARTVAVSDAVARWLQAEGLARRGRVRVVENGVDLVRFSEPVDRARARARLGLPQEASIVGAVGRLDRQKGHDLLVRALPRLLASRPDAVVAIAGEGPERGALEELARRLDVAARVRLLGHQEEVPLFLGAVDAVAMPSRWEGFGLSLVEALAAGRACVATAVDSLPSILEGAGTLVPPEDPDALARALADALRGPRDLLEARVRASRYRIDRMVEGWQAVYDEALGRA